MGPTEHSFIDKRSLGQLPASWPFSEGWVGGRSEGKMQGLCLGEAALRVEAVEAWSPLPFTSPASLWEACSVSYLVNRLRITDRCGVNCERARMPRPRGPCLQGALSISPFILNLPSGGEEAAESLKS